MDCVVQLGLHQDHIVLHCSQKSVVLLLCCCPTAEVQPTGHSRSDEHQDATVCVQEAAVGELSSARHLSHCLGTASRAAARLNAERPIKCTDSQGCGLCLACLISDCCCQWHERSDQGVCGVLSGRELDIGYRTVCTGKMTWCVVRGVCPGM
jgi:hypothetical protein